MSKKSTPWKDEHERMKDSMCKPPEGCLSLEQIAAELDMSEDNAMKMVVKPLIREGRAEEVPGHKRNASNAVIKTKYYRLVGDTA